MLAGTIIAQALPLAASPLLARLYSPEAFGLQSLFMGIVTSVSVLATCRMDLALVLPEEDREAASLAGFVLCTTLLAAGGVLLFTVAVQLLSTRSFPAVWLFLLPLMVCATSLYQVSLGFASRHRAFRKVVNANVSNQVVYVASAMAMGFAGAWIQALAVAKVIGQMFGTSMLSQAVASNLAAAARRFSLRDSLSAARKYHQFLVFNTPYSLVGSVMRDAPVYIFSAFAAVGMTGFFWLARTVMLAPTLLTSNAFSQVFYREAMALKGTPELETLTTSLLRLGMLTAAPLFAFCVAWGDSAFASVFGERWHMAGVFAMILAPAAWMSIQTGWPERLFEVNMRQGVSFGVQLGSDIATSGTFAAVYLLTHDAVIAMIAFAACNVVYHHLFLAAIFRISQFNGRHLASTLGAGWAVFLGCCAGQLLLRQQTGSQGMVPWILGLALAVALAALIGWRLITRLPLGRIDAGGEI